MNNGRNLNEDLSAFREASRVSEFPVRQPLMWHSLIFCLLLGVSVASVWPVAIAPTSLIPTTEDGFSTVPLFNAWTIIWNADRLSNGLTDYWNAPIFFPVAGTFAFSEPQPATMLVAPVFWLTGSPALAYNVYLILSLSLNGWFTVRLLRRLRLSWMSSLAAGIAMVLHPMAHSQGDVVQLMAVWPVIWTLTAIHDLRAAASEPEVDICQQRRRVLQKGAEAGLAYASVFFVAIHHGLFLTLLAACSAWILIPWSRLRFWSQGAVVGIIVTAALLLPLLLPVYHILQTHQFVREENLVGELSTHWSDVLRVSPSALIQLPAVAVGQPWPLLPGVIRLMFALLALTALRPPPGSRVCWMVPFLVLLSIESVVYSLGTNLTLGEWKPWLTLCRWFPGFSQVRSAFRFGYFFQLSVILLCAVGFDSFSRWMLRALQRWSRAAKCLLAAIAMLVAFEVPPSRVKVVGVPGLSRVEPWQEFVKRNLSPGKCIVFLPYVQGKSVEQFDLTVRWMLRTTPIHVPILNGYSGFFPAAHFTSQKLLSDDPFSAESLDHMLTSGVQYIAIQGPRSHPIPAIPARTAHRLQRVFLDTSGITIYSLQ